MKYTLKFMSRSLAGLFLLGLLVTGITAQTTDDEPVVISRDEDPVATTSTRSDVRESVPKSDTIVVPREAAAEPARATSTVYNITLSEAQQKMMLFLDVLTKAETRAESLRTSLFEMIEKENSVMSRLKQIEYSLRPDQIQNAAALTGSLRPEDVREDRQNFLQSERRNLESLLRQIQSNRRNLENSIVSADRLVERIRVRFEAYVEEALLDGMEI